MTVENRKRRTCYFIFARFLFCSFVCLFVFFGASVYDLNAWTNFSVYLSD